MKSLPIYIFNIFRSKYIAIFFNEQITKKKLATFNLIASLILSNKRTTLNNINNNMIEEYKNII
jgi:hypothetical protein